MINEKINPMRTYTDENGSIFIEFKSDKIYNLLKKFNKKRAKQIEKINKHL